MKRNNLLRDPVEYLNTTDIIDIVIKSSYWANPESFRIITENNNCDAPGVFFPYCKRKIGANPVRGWTFEGDNSYFIDQNQKAQDALSISMFGKGFQSNCKGYTCGHIYGDEYIHKWNNHTCIANMFLIPQSLQSLTDYHPAVIKKLKSISYRLYKWKPNDIEFVENSITNEEYNSITVLKPPDKFKQIYFNNLKKYYNQCIAKSFQPAFSLIAGAN